MAADGGEMGLKNHDNQLLVACRRLGLQIGLMYINLDLVGQIVSDRVGP